MKPILVICPTHRDLRELKNKKISKEHEIIFYGDDASEHLDRFKPLDFIDEAVKKFRNVKLAGVISTDDYPGCIIASIIAKKFRLPHVEPEKILICQHKYYSRILQKKIMPEVVPEFELIKLNSSEPYKITLQYPFFVKPVKSFFSIFANRINNKEELKKIIKEYKSYNHKFVGVFNQLLRNYTNLNLSADYLIAESLLAGQQVTVEGFSYKKDVKIIGIVDSIMFPNTNCFQRFHYPSKLKADILQRMERISAKIINGIGFDNGIFNIEMFYNPKDKSIKIIEINPRMCSQFADIMEKLHGINTYELQIDLSIGRKPYFIKNQGDYNTSASFVLRTFQNMIVKKTPSKEQINLLMKEMPDIRLEIFVKEGMWLSDTLQDGKSYRYGLINIGAKDDEELFEKFKKCSKYLNFEFVLPKDAKLP